ncbi:hypothetical protein QRD43_20915 [Pelomonas sp. APW6]|uniref:Uncharacterized protein n=1 Tax=Roseateles subflavus TaxID=3053353 RepID=A0ABT7LQ96_9BURK|nr:hypothetical protein [Pelomonas sp. APW6]MDL5034377.1 hypothetical protein [Pelomonas sp. APW6]
MAQYLPSVTPWPCFTMLHDTPLDSMPLAQISPEVFANYAIVLGVAPNADPASPRRIVVPPQESEALGDLRDELARVARNFTRAPGRLLASVEDIETRLFMGLMSREMAGDAFYNRLPGGKPMVIARIDVIDAHGRTAVAQAMHRLEVEAAVQRGEEVPEATLAFYRAAPAHRNQPRAG